MVCTYLVYAWRDLPVQVRAHVFMCVCVIFLSLFYLIWMSKTVSDMQLLLLLLPQKMQLFKQLRVFQACILNLMLVCLHHMKYTCKVYEVSFNPPLSRLIICELSFSHMPDSETDIVFHWEPQTIFTSLARTDRVFFVCAQIIPVYVVNFLISLTSVSVYRDTVL